MKDNFQVRSFKLKYQLNDQELLKLVSIKKNIFKKIYIEIGCGAGLHPIKFCQKNPDSLLIAFERTKVKFKALQNRVLNHPAINNLIIVNQDATELLPSILLDIKVDGYFLLYPNPYPKDRQSNKRWLRSSFFHFILASLKKRGQVIVCSNLQTYTEEAKLYLNNFWKLNYKENIFKNGDISPRTHFEKKYLSRGLSTYQLTIIKPQ